MLKSQATSQEETLFIKMYKLISQREIFNEMWTKVFFIWVMK